MSFEDDDDEIAVYIVPKLDEAASDEAEQKLRDKLKDAVPDIGKGFFDALGDSGALEMLGEKVGTILADPLKDFGETVGLNLEDPLKKVLTQDFGGALEDVMEQVGPQLATTLGSVLADPLQDVGDALGVNVGNAIEKALKGDTQAAMDQVASELGNKLGSVLGDGLREATGLDLDLSGIGDQLKPLADIVNSFKSHDFAGGLHGAAAMFGDGAPSGDDGGMFGGLASLLGQVGGFGDAIGHGGISKYGNLGAAGASVLNSFTKDDAPPKPLTDSLFEILGAAGGGAAIGGAIPLLGETGIPEIIGALIGGGGELLHNWDSLGKHMPWSDAAPDEKPREPTPEELSWRGAMSQMRSDALGVAMFGEPAPGEGFIDTSDQKLPNSLYDTKNLSQGGLLGKDSGGASANNQIEMQATQAAITAGSVTLSAGSVSLPDSLFGGLSKDMDFASSGLQTGLEGPDYDLFGDTPKKTAPPQRRGKQQQQGGKEAAPRPEKAAPPLTGFDGSGAAGAGTSSLYGGFSQGGILPGDSPGHDNMVGLLPGGHMVGLEGGEGVIRPGAMQTPGVADIVASLNKHYSGGTPPGETVSGAPVNAAPTGKQNTGNEVIGGDHGPESGVHPDESAMPGKETPQLPGTPARPGQEQPGHVIDPHGTGQGFGIQGGLIGMAEGAAVGAASMTPAGPAGGMAAQAAMQEINNAVGYAGKVAGILGIEMPLDTFGLSDSRYSNVAQSWVGKIGLSLVGGHHDTPDVAGKTQAPLTGPNEHGSPLGGKQGGGGMTVNIGTQTNHGSADHETFARALSNQNPENYAYESGRY